VLERDSAFILHSRPYRETSRLVDFFSLSHGRVRAVARGVRGNKAKYSHMQPFVRLQIGCRGKGDLKTLAHCESDGGAVQLPGERLFSALYINELLYRLLPELDPHPQLFTNYSRLLALLEQRQDIEPLLRQFELALLDELGYGLTLDIDAETGNRVLENGLYQLIPDHGLIHCPADRSAQKAGIFKGSELLAISAGNYQSAEVSRSAKRLLRMVIHFHLGGRQLRSRELFKTKSGETTR